MTTCREVMTSNPTCAVPTDSVERVAQMMKSENVGPIPVVESKDSKKLVGIVTDRDLVLKVLAEGRSGQNTNVDAVMTRNVTACREDDNLDRALQAMADQQIRRIPIVNGNNEIVGIIAQADVATRTEQPRKTADVVEEISKPAASGA
jgi:CBS domain-containing protein